jgi:hypothetical protein
MLHTTLKFILQLENKPICTVIKMSLIKDILENLTLSNNEIMLLNSNILELKHIRCMI